MLILLIAENCLDLKIVLEKCGYRVLTFDSIATIQQEQLDLAIISIAEMKTLPLLQKQLSRVPKIVYSEHFDPELAAQVVGQGVQDYIIQDDLKVETLMRTVAFAVERHKQLEMLHELIYRDELTSLYNRRGFLALATQQLHIAARFQKGFFLFLIDIDRLKEINDTLGHSEGDKALIHLSECLKNAFRTSDIIARLGGDEFAVLALHSQGSDALPLKIALENQLKSTAPPLSVSMGYSYFDPASEMSLEELLEKADQDLYTQKKMRV